MDKIIIKGAREHNLKSINVEIPKNKLVVFTGLSGSGKSSLAFDTIYAEGQRRYVESLSSYARQFLGIMKKPDVDLIEGLSPAISIDQKSTSHNPRSTVGTVTEIYDYLRLLFARVGHPHCPNCAREIAHLSKDQIVDSIFELLKKQNLNIKLARIKLLILSPIVKDRKGEYSQLFQDIKKRGYKKVRIDGEIFSLDDNFVLIKTNKHTIEIVIDELVLTKDTDRLRISDDAEKALKFGNGELIASIIKDPGFSLPDKPKKMEDELFSEKFACPTCGISLPEIEPRIFSFNTPHGACPTCNGLGTVLSVDKDLVFNNNLSISEGGILPFPNIYYQDTWFSRTFITFCEKNGIPLTKRFSEIPEDKKKLLIDGTGDKEYEVKGKNRWGRSTVIYEPFSGVLHEIKQKYTATESPFMKSQIERFMRYEICSLCHGGRLKRQALSVTIDGKSIVEVSDMAISDSLNFMKTLVGKISKREEEIGKLIIKEIKDRLTFLMDVGLDYLTLSRGAQTLAGGEAQRIRLASQIGSGLTGVLYVLDEPSIGLHPRDNNKLIMTLKKLRDLGNTVIVVEHDKETMEKSDFILDFGPGAGEKGGEIVSKGPVEQIKNDPNSLTGAYLSGRKKIDIKTTNGISSNRVLRILKAKEHNLKNINVEFPLKKFIVITGVSGSGKSTLVNDILYHGLMQIKNPFHREKPGDFQGLEGYENIKHVFLIDQSPIGRTPRSNPATYTGCFTYIRDLFSKTKEAKIRGYKQGRFSFNVKGGRCETCQGEGQIKIGMQFLPDVYIKCELCEGKQYNFETLEVQFSGKNIAEVLSMSVSEAFEFFSFVPGLFHKLLTLNDVGLSYIKLGQPAPTLSGGEAQRVKLATELSKKGKDSLYLLDEPTTGLHFADLQKLLNVLRKLVDQGNTVIVIEHNMDIIKNADFVIDLGPEGGEKGGKVIAKGTPKDIINVPDSYTGQFLKRIL
ncbi:MAG: excinuclease ABC subunit A [Candidatus Levybacteria bacterium RIFCSPLOWO2_01_FULL_38_13]|nr:MAG: excinuclease ABC subunit A [Candidatus Levybacteria bacterium RIFCSPHIGHO2_01_FULL_41_15]OGH35311.1 MAG: excinuclease ABC subunit A [Candidatus Levybacteria bacterium RIFCSPLOWO2_01_FULL_38_13]